jgi:exodeoxyribonuclease V alpha subunit
MTIEYQVAINSVLRAVTPGAVFAGRAIRIGRPNGEVKQVRVIADIQPVVGEVWRIRGGWHNHPQHGWQLQAHEAHRTTPSGALVVPFLRRRLPEIGEARAKRLRALGDDLVAIVAAGDAERLAAVIEPRFPALSARLAASIIREWSVLRGEVETLDWMERHGVTDARAAMRIVAVLREQARRRLEMNPYILASFMSWRTVEKVALPILRRIKKDPLDTPERLLGAITSTVRDILQEGSTALADDELRTGLARRLGAGRVERAIRIGERNLGIIRFAQGWRAPGCAAMEDTVARRFTAMAAGQERSAVHVPDEAALRQLLVMRARGTPLSPEQQDAAVKALSRPLSAIVGYAGCGKTTWRPRGSGDPLRYRGPASDPRHADSDRPPCTDDLQALARGGDCQRGGARRRAGTPR